MKTAIYIEDGKVQLVITPESEFEKNSIRQFSERPMQAKIFSGAFYDCRGGWVRQTAFRTAGVYSIESEDQSLILSYAEPEEKP